MNKKMAGNKGLDEGRDGWSFGIHQVIFEEVGSERFQWKKEESLDLQEKKEEEEEELEEEETSIVRSNGGRREGKK